jgi:hypothetical protein
MPLLWSPGQIRDRARPFSTSQSDIEVQLWAALLPLMHDLSCIKLEIVLDPLFMRLSFLALTIFDALGCRTRQIQRVHPPRPMRAADVFCRLAQRCGPGTSSRDRRCLTCRGGRRTLRSQTSVGKAPWFTALCHRQPIVERLFA